MPELILTLLVVVLAGMVQGTIGFGFGLVAMGLLPFWMPVQEAVPLVAVLCIFVNAALAVKLRRHLVWANVGPMIAGAAVGTPLGVWLLRTLDASWLLLSLGVLLAIYAIQQVGFSKAGASERTLWSGWGAVAGLAGGLLGGAFNTGGPPAVLYVGLKRWPKEATVSTLQAFFLFVSGVQLALFAWTGMLSLEVLKTDAMLVVPVAIGVLCGQQIYQRVNQERFRLWMLIGIAILGFSLILKGWPF